MSVQTYWLEKTDRVQVNVRQGEEPWRVLHADAARADWVRELPDKCWEGRREQAPAGHDLLVRSVYAGAPGGKLIPTEESGPGAMWHAEYLEDYPEYRGPDGICLWVRLPNMHIWMVDSRASNCDMREDKVHKCWVRHGDPRQANLTVDKNGVTCHAGAGSILAGDYHGFLRNGMLVTA